MEKILIDSSVFLEVLLRQEKEKKAGEMLREVTSGKVRGVVSSMTIAEVKYHALNRLGPQEAEDARHVVQFLPNSEVVSVTPEIASVAAEIRHKYYDAKTRPVSFADAIQIVTALEAGCSKIISGDPHFKGLEEIEAVVY